MTSTDTASHFTHPDRNLAMELVRATEAAAIRATPWIGRGDKNAADGAAVDAMRKFLGTVNFDGVIVIGEGEKDNAPMLFNGEHVGNGRGPAVDIAVQRSVYGTGPITPAILQEQQAIADTFFDLKLIPKKIRLLDAAVGAL